MPRPRSLTESQLALAALAVIERDGLDSLSMRAVAKELGKSVMALYRYVADREALELLIVEHVLGAVDTSPPPAAGTSWRGRVETMAERLRAGVAAYPAVVPLTLTHRHRSVSSLRWSESVLAILAEAGIDGRQRIFALRGLVSYVVGAIQLGHLGALSGSGTTALSRLPTDTYPRLAETAREARHVDTREEFNEGLAMLLRGLPD